MPNVGDLLERESRTVDLAPGDFDRLLDRRERKARQRRIAAGVVASVVALATVAVLLRSFAIAPVPVAPSDPPGALAYFSYGDIWVADWNGSNEVKIVDGRPGTDGCTDEYWSDGGPIWSPDGRYLAARHAVCEDGTPDWWDVVIFDVDGNVVSSFPSEGWLIPWSPDSTRIAAWTTWGETIGIFGLDGELRKELPVPAWYELSGDYDPVWSRDGSSLMLPGGVVIPIDGSVPYRLPPSDPLSQLDATFSPDGERVAYVDSGRLFVAAADGTDPRVVDVGNGWIRAPVWSPTGDRIAFAYSDRVGRPTEVRIVDVATGEVTGPVGEGSDDSFSPIEFSPRGDQILIRRTSDHDLLEPAVWVMNADGTGARRVVVGTLGDWRSV